MSWQLPGFGGFAGLESGGLGLGFMQAVMV